MLKAKQLGLYVYRVFMDGAPLGFSLDGSTSLHREKELVDVLRDEENGVAVHLFDTEQEAAGFMHGLHIAGVDASMSAMSPCNLGCWGVIREVEDAQAWEEMSPDGCIVVEDLRSDPKQFALRASHQRTLLPVAHWDSTIYQGSAECGLDFQMEIDDQRQRNGQTYLTISAESGEIEDFLSVTAEIQHIPGTETATPCFHVHIGNALAFSIFQVGLNRVHLRTEADVEIARGSSFPNGEPCYAVEVI